MNLYRSITTLSIITVVLFSCSKTADQEIMNKVYECAFVQNDDTQDGLIDDMERMIMNECMDNSLSTRSEIKNNILGEWELIGHGEGWVPKVSQPCAYITINEESLIFEFKNAHTDTVIVHQWDIRETDNNGQSLFSLDIFSEYEAGLFINQFCEDYMYGDGTPSDGNMHLYKKVK